MLGFGALRSFRAGGYGIAKPLQTAGKALLEKGGMYRMPGKAIHAMGMRPGRTIAGGIAAVGAIHTYNTSGKFGGHLNDQLRQGTMYNRRMRSGQSSALSGLQPRSMGGYA